MEGLGVEVFPQGAHLVEINTHVVIIFHEILIPSPGIMHLRGNSFWSGRLRESFGHDPILDLILFGNHSVLVNVLNLYFSVRLIIIGRGTDQTIHLEFFIVSDYIHSLLLILTDFLNA